MERIRIELLDKDNKVLEVVEGEVTKEVADMMLERVVEFKNK